MNGYVKIKPHPDFSHNDLFLSSDRSRLIKVHKPKEPTKHRYRLLRLFGFPVPHEFRSERERCAHERHVLAHWASKGFSVPRIIEGDGLIVEYIDGAPLSAVLSEDGPLERKLSLVEQLFRECDRRHAKVFADGDRDLIKYDANLRNVIVSDRGLVHIDFEGGKVMESLVRGATREIARYAVEAVKAIGEQHGGEVASLLLRTYTHPAPLARIAAEKTKPLPPDFSTRHLARLI
jgi:tRNA A-37 threonylcarbamoyl transferase component Bud32